MTTVALSNGSWDIALDGLGNIAMKQDAAARTQDVCSACRVFLGEVYYNPNTGVPYLDDVLGLETNAAGLEAYYISAARTVEGIVDAKLIVDGVTSRGLNGRLYSSSTNLITIQDGVALL